MSWWQAFWVFLPAGIANMSPVLANKIPLLNKWTTPLDFGKSWHNKRISGNNKTWRGLIFGTFGGGLCGWLIFIIQPSIFENVARSTSFSNIHAILLGCALGFGALFGDAVESFFKRRRNVASGEKWFPFDQLDYIIGGLIFAFPLIRLSLSSVAQVLIIYFMLHLIVSYIGYLLKLKDKPI